MNVTIGIPIVGDVPGEAFPNHAMLIAKIARTERISIPAIHNVMPHDRARLQIFEVAEKNDSDYVFFMDADMIIPDSAFCDLLDVMVHKRPRPVAVSGRYARRGWPYTCVWSLKNPESPSGWDQVDAPDGVHQIHITGFGCCLIDMRWVRENLEKPYSYQKAASEVTDDVTFFEKVLEKGGIVYGNANVRCGHLGERQVICDRTETILRRMHIEISRDREEKLDTSHISEEEIRSIIAQKG